MNEEDEENLNQYGSLAYWLDQIVDPRDSRKSLHSVVDCAAVGIWGYACGFKNIDQIAFAAELTSSNENSVSKYLGLKNGPPTKSTLWRVFSSLDPYELNRAMTEWILGTDELLGDFFNVDGKAIKSARDVAGGKRLPPYVLSIVESKTRVTIALRKIRVKSSEMTHVPELIRELGEEYPWIFRGAIFSADALNSQPATFEACKSVGAYYLSPVKKNKEKAFYEIEGILNGRLGRFRLLARSMATDEALKEAGLDVCVENPKEAHGRRDKRVAVTCLLNGGERITGMPGVSTVARVYRFRLVNGKKRKSGVTRTLYQCTKPLNAKQLLSLIVRHWNIEALHYLLDTQLDEDHSRAKKGAILENLSVIRRMALNIVLLSPQLKGYKSTFEKQLVCLENPEIVLDGIFEPLEHYMS